MDYTNDLVPSGNMTTIQVDIPRNCSHMFSSNFLIMLGGQTGTVINIYISNQYFQNRNNHLILVSGRPQCCGLAKTYILRLVDEASIRPIDMNSEIQLMPQTLQNIWMLMIQSQIRHLQYQNQQLQQQIELNQAMWNLQQQATGSGNGPFFQNTNQYVQYQPPVIDDSHLQVSNRIHPSSGQDASHLSTAQVFQANRIHPSVGQDASHLSTAQVLQATESSQEHTISLDDEQQTLPQNHPSSGISDSSPNQVSIEDDTSAFDSCNDK